MYYNGNFLNFFIFGHQKPGLDRESLSPDSISPDLELWLRVCYTRHQVKEKAGHVSETFTPETR
jgi:hypothetical protein